VSHVYPLQRELCDDHQRHLILEQAKLLLEQYSFEALTMEQIAQHLQLPLDTLNDLFTDKEQLLLAVLQRCHDSGRRCTMECMR